MIILINKIFRKSLQMIFGFDKWHVATLQERPYAGDIINYCNKVNSREIFAEIGCGLGDITRNVLFDKRTGYDMEAAVLRAAKWLPAKNKGSKPDFREFTFPESVLADKPDMLVMVNWIHHVEPAVLREKIAQYYNENLRPGGQLILDTVADPAYKYNHDIRQLTSGLDCSLHLVGKYARDREVWAIIKKD
jgi:SAM-dependent methyltransferase